MMNYNLAMEVFEKLETSGQYILINNASKLKNPMGEWRSHIRDWICIKNKAKCFPNTLNVEKFLLQSPKSRKVMAMPLPKLLSCIFMSLWGIVWFSWQGFLHFNNCSINSWGEVVFGPIFFGLHVGNHSELSNHRFTQSTRKVRRMKEIITLLIAYLAKLKLLPQKFEYLLHNRLWGFRRERIR